MVGVAFQLRKGMKNYLLCAHVLHQNLEFGHFMLFCKGWQRNVPEFKTYVQGDHCFSTLNLFFCGVVIAVTVIVA